MGRSVLPLLSGEFVEVGSHIDVQLKGFKKRIRAGALLSGQEHRGDNKPGDNKIDRQGEDPKVRALLNDTIGSFFGQSDRQAVRARMTLQSDATLGFIHPLLKDPVFVELTVTSRMPIPENDLAYGADYSLQSNLAKGVDASSVSRALAQIAVYIQPTRAFEINHWSGQERILTLADLLNEGGVTVEGPPLPLDSVYPVETSFVMVIDKQPVAEFPAVLYSDFHSVTPR